jgi:Tfp pilus assembly protein FimT
VCCSTLHKGRAYTLVELTVVIFLIGLVLVLTVPRVQHTLFSDDLKAATRRMIGTVRTLRDNAVRDQKAYILHFDMALNRFWVSWDAMTAEEAFVLSTSTINAPERKTWAMRQFASPNRDMCNKR